MMLHHLREAKASNVFQKGPLLTRSWAFQERILSPRAVDYHSCEMVWECNEAVDCEWGEMSEGEPTIPFASNTPTVKARYRLKPAHEHVMMLHHLREAKASNVFQKGPLLTRSWAFQERILSPRAVDYHSCEMVWECNEAVDCEWGEMSEGEPGMYDDNLAVGKRWRFELETGPHEGDPTIFYPPLNRWLDGMELYSRLRITDLADKLPALEGLAARFSDRIHAKYLAGH